MKIIRYEDVDGEIGYAVQQPDGSAKRIKGDIYASFQVMEETVKISRLLAPVAPVQIFGIGLNFRHHATETNTPVPKFPILFMKGINAIQNPGGPILIPTVLPSHEVDYECELAVIIGKKCKNVTREKALDYVLGYTCANDVSARDWQIAHGGTQWCRGKTFDTFAPLGPCLSLKDEIPNPNKLRLRCIVSGELLQDWTTEDMVFDVPAIIAFLSGSTTLLPGTVILTGTPHGVGLGRKPPRWLNAGDVVTVEVEGIGSLVNPVQDEKA